jgi:DNA-binding transcriptional regulator YhcF (GntR family)
MTAEWDQQDPYFKQYAQTEFENSLAVLASEGVTVEEIQAYMEKRILDEKVRADYVRFLKTLKKQDVSEDEASEAAIKFMEKS